MKKYGFFQKIGKSLVPSDFYIQILQERLYKAFIYMLLFVLMLSTIVGIYRGYQITSTINQFNSEYKQGIIPHFKISGDGLWIEGDGVITLDYFDVPIVMHDEGIIDINDVIHYENVIFLEKDRIVVTSPNFETLVTDYSSINDMLNILLLDEFDSEVYVEAMSQATLMTILMVPFIIGMLFLLTTFTFFYYSFFVLLITNILRAILGVRIRLGQLFHMVIYAMTFSTFWTNFTMVLPRRVPSILNTLVHFVLPAIIILNVLMIIRRKANENTGD